MNYKIKKALQRIEIFEKSLKRYEEKKLLSGHGTQRNALPSAWEFDAESADVEC